MSLDLVFQNDDLIVADKPHGWLTTPSRDPKDPRPCLGRDLQKSVGQQIYPVHRLDFEVSGLVLFAKTAIAHREAQSWFEHGLVKKVYEAYSQAGSGHHEDWVEWRSKLAKGKRRAFEAPHGKDSHTRARVVEASPKYWKWELSPVTGRPHQLRFEMFRHGFPILGDALYGGAPIEPSDKILLRATQLDFAGIEVRFGLPEVLIIDGLKL